MSQIRASCYQRPPRHLDTCLRAHWAQASQPWTTNLAANHEPNKLLTGLGPRSIFKITFEASGFKPFNFFSLKDFGLHKWHHQNANESFRQWVEGSPPPVETNSACLGIINESTWAEQTKYTTSQVVWIEENKNGSKPWYQHVVKKKNPCGHQVIPKRMSHYSSIFHKSICTQYVGVSEK